MKFISHIFFTFMMVTATTAYSLPNTLFLSGRSLRGTVVNISGGHIRLLTNDSIDLRGEVRDANNSLVDVVPLRLHDNYFPDFLVSINYLNELTIKTGRPSYYPTSITVEADVGFVNQWLQFSVDVVRSNP